MRWVAMQPIPWGNQDTIPWHLNHHFHHSNLLYRTSPFLLLLDKQIFHLDPIAKPYATSPYWVLSFTNNLNSNFEACFAPRNASTKFSFKVENYKQKGINFKKIVE